MEGDRFMQTIKFVHWQEEDAFLGYLVDYPDYWTQGETFDDLKEHLIDLYRDIASGDLSGIRKLDELVVPCSSCPAESFSLLPLPPPALP